MIVVVAVGGSGAGRSDAECECDGGASEHATGTDAGLAKAVAAAASASRAARNAANAAAATVDSSERASTAPPSRCCCTHRRIQSAANAVPSGPTLSSAALGMRPAATASLVTPHAACCAAVAIASAADVVPDPAQIMPGAAHTVNRNDGARQGAWALWHTASAFAGVGVGSAGKYRTTPAARGAPQPVPITDTPPVEPSEVPTSPPSTSTTVPLLPFRNSAPICNLANRESMMATLTLLLDEGKLVPISNTPPPPPAVPNTTRTIATVTFVHCCTDRSCDRTARFSTVLLSR